MKILIISDSHGLEEQLFEVMDRHQQDVDLILHCGDSELPHNLFSPYKDKLLIVRGNCDLDENYQEELIFSKNEVNVFLTHGHLYNVKSTLLNLTYRAKETDSNLVCFGHSHIAGCAYEDGILYINPGSLRLPRRIEERSYAIVTYEEETIKVVFLNELGKEIPQLKTVYKIG